MVVSSGYRQSFYLAAVETGVLPYLARFEGLAPGHSRRLQYPNGE